jgi:DNA-binding transcriptional regulator YdaS (Cro superfamily)
MRLGEYLRSADISQTRFAAQIGLRQPSVSRLISGMQNPSATTTRKIQSATQGAVGPADWAPVKKRRRAALLPGV